MTSLQASVGLAQLKKINYFINKKKNIYKMYNNEFKSNVLIKIIPTFKISENAYWLYTLCIENINESIRDKLITFLKSKSIESRPMFYPLNVMPPYKKYGKGKFHNSKALSYKSITIPSHIYLEKKQIKFISRNILNFINKSNIKLK